MKPVRILAIICCLGRACGFVLPAALAGEWNQMAKLMVNKPIQIPGIALPVGTYWLVLLDSPANHNMVQILSADRSKVYATMFTVPTSREQPTDRAEIKIAERPH